MRSAKNVFSFLVLVTGAIFCFEVAVASAADDSGKKIKQFEERTLKQIQEKKRAAGFGTVFAKAYNEIDQELKSSSPNHAAAIQWEGLKESLQKIESGLKNHESCEKIKSEIFLNYGNRAADEENMPQFARTAVVLLSRMCKAQ